MDSFTKQRVESIETSGCNVSGDDINRSHDEYQYLDLIEDILKKGHHKSDRTGTGTVSVFGTQSRYSLRNGESRNNFNHSLLHKTGERVRIECYINFISNKNFCQLLFDF